MIVLLHVRVTAAKLAMDLVLEHRSLLDVAVARVLVREDVLQHVRVLVPVHRSLLDVAVARVLVQESVLRHVPQLVLEAVPVVVRPAVRQAVPAVVRRAARHHAPRRAQTAVM